MNLKLEEAKTKEFVEVLNKFEAGKTLVVLPTIPNECKVERAARNLPEVKLACPRSINAYSLLKYEKKF